MSQYVSRHSVRFLSVVGRSWNGVAGVLTALACSVLTCSIGKAAEPSPTFDAAAIEFFEKEVRPVLVNRCYECHSHTAKKVQGNLWLDSRAAVLKGGDTGPAATPGKPKESLLIDSINYGETYQMPPKSKMPANEIAALTRWVEMGLPWPKEEPKKPGESSVNAFDLAARKAAHWCWKPVRKPAQPAVKNTAWPAQPLDRFILAKLEEAGLSPNVEADKRTLLRRLSFDLIGLPPTRSEMQAFLDDNSPNAYEKAVDGLLRSPHFGERWARHWMDLVRYAETYGHEFDFAIPHPSQYRDYLIRAFNEDVPYNQFVVEHLAGDLLAEPRRNREQGFNESILGTGFWFLGEATHAPVDVRGDEQGRLENQLDVMSKTFLGVTLACARCHDHKFDAISTRDYYALSGVLKSSRRQEALLDPGDRISEGSHKLAEIRERTQQSFDRTAREIAAKLGAPASGESAAESETARLLQATRDVRVRGPDSLKAVADERKVDADLLQRWLKAMEDPAARQPTHPLQPWLELTGAEEPAAAKVEAVRKRLEGAASRGAEFREKSPLVVDFNQPDYDRSWTSGWAFGNRPTQSGDWDASSTEPRLAAPGVANSRLRSNREQGVVRSPTFTLTHRNVLYRLRGHNVQIRLYIDNYFMDVYSGLLFGGCNQKVDNRLTWGWLVQGGDVSRYVGHRAYFEVLDLGDGYAEIDEVRLSDSGPPPDAENPLALQILATSVKEGESSWTTRELANRYGQAIDATMRNWSTGKLDSAGVELINWMLQHRLVGSSEQLASLGDIANKATVELEQQAKLLPAPLRALAITDGSGQDDRIHIRGNHRTLGEPAPRRLLEALESPIVSEQAPGSGRLEIAKAVVDPANPLTSRVMVNRVWHHLLGRGIVASVDNFGVLGQTPTHPELLDHLASQFMAEGWSVKQLIRSIVLSKTYRMSSAPDGKGDEIDPQNLLLHRQRIRRLQGEAIRDSILRISGRLDPKPYGGSVPVHLTPFMQGRGRPGGSGPLDGNGRRSLYTEVRRNFLPPMMLAFDTPIPFSTVGARNTSNVPAQALILMNDPLVVEQAGLWAKRLLAVGEAAAEVRIGWLYEDALGRPPTTQETAAALEFMDAQGQELKLSSEAARRDPRVWADLAHVIWNVKEFVYIP
ncbi:MAG: PSD1 and planctomycete cytochrome C domain-containing protein [Pirellulales bacterium]